MKPTIPALLSLAACVPHTLPESGPPTSLDDGVIDPTEHLAMEDALGSALERLEALDLVNVGELVQHAPEASSNCYGPCYDEPQWQQVLAERAMRIDRLQRFVDVAEDVHASVDSPSGTPFDELDALQQLNALEIIDFESIDWEMSGACYVSMCPGDDVRRARIERLIASTTDL